MEVRKNFSRYCRANTNYIVKYNLRTERVEAQLRVSGYIPRKNTYSWGGYSGMDLAADEQGLWVLWGSTSNSYRLYASKIDVHQNVITYVWALNTGKFGFDKEDLLSKRNETYKALRKGK